MNGCGAQAITIKKPIARVDLPAASQHSTTVLQLFIPQYSGE